MKLFLVVALVAVLYCFSPNVVSAHTVVPKKTVSANVQSLLTNDRLLDNYIQCLLDLKPCSREGLNLKKLLPNAIQTNCLNCTPSQRQNARKLITFLRLHRLHDWRRLTDKYDPNGLFNARN